MAYRPPTESNVRRAVEFLRDLGRFAPVSEIAAAIGVKAKALTNTLPGRAAMIGDVECVNRQWRYVAQVDRKSSKPAGSGVIAQPRAAPVFVEMTGYLANLPIRPGAFDMLSLPSRMGDKRIKP